MSDGRATGGGDVEAQNLLRQSGEAKNERQERIRHLEKEAFQLANYYFVFQGVIFTSFYHVPHLTCKYHWFPFSLSLLAGLLNFCALLRIALRYKSALDDADISSTGGDGVIAVTCASYWRCFYVVGCMIGVLAFLAVALAGCWLITCLQIDFGVVDGRICPLRGLPAGKSRSVSLSLMRKNCWECGSADWLIRVLINDHFP